MSKRFILLLILAFASTGLFAKTITVGKSGADYSSVQDAVDHAQKEDVIEIIDNEVYNERVVIDSTKSGISLVSKSYLDDIETGGKRWMDNMPTILYQDKDRVLPQSNSDLSKGDAGINFDQNGAMFLSYAKEVVIAGIKIDGGGIYKDWTDNDMNWGVQLYGNNAIAVRNCKRVTIKYCDIKNALRGLHLKDRNIKGIYAEPDPNDIDKDQYAPGADPLAMGLHVIEHNRIHDCHWGIFADAMKDGASAIRFNLIYNNYTRDVNGFINEAKSDNVKADPIQWAGGAFKIHGITYVPLEIYNNTFWKNGDIFNSHWGNGNTNFRIYNNLFALRNGLVDANNDIYTNGYNSDDMLFGRTYGRIIRYNGFQRQHSSTSDAEVPNYTFENGGARPSITGDVMSKVFTTDISAQQNLYIAGGSGDIFKSTDEGSSEFLVPKSPDDASEVADGINEKGDPNGGVYDKNGNRADLGAFSTLGNWQSAGFLELLDRERYAVVDFQRDADGVKSAVVDLRPFLRWNSDKSITDIKVTYQKYSNTVSKTGSVVGRNDLDYVQSTLDDDQEKKDLINQLNSGNDVELRYVANALDFKAQGDYGRFYLQFEATTDDGSTFKTKIGYFDYRVSPIQIYVKLFDYSTSDNTTGDEWESGKNIFINTPFYAEISAFDISQNMPKDMTQYNDNGNGGILAFAETVRDGLQEWKDDNGNGQIDDGEWQKVKYLQGKWTDQGKYENVFRITQPTQGEQEYYRVFLQGSETSTSMMSGASKMFRVLTIADSILFYGDDITPDGTWQPENGSTRNKIKVAVVDENGNRMVGQWIKVSIANNGDKDMGSLLDPSTKEKVDALLVKTDSKGYATVYVNITDELGVTGKLIAQTNGKLLDNGDTAVVTGELPITPAFVDTVGLKVMPNPISRKEIIEIVQKNGTSIGPENYDVNTVNQVLSNGASGNPGIGILDIPVHTGSKGGGTEKVHVDVIITNAQASIVKNFKPKSSDGNIYVVDPDALAGGKIQLSKSLINAKFVEPGVIEKPKSSDIRVAVPWNHVNAKGRIAESGAFFVRIEIAKDDGTLIKRLNKIVLVK